MEPVGSVPAERVTRISGLLRRDISRASRDLFPQSPPSRVQLRESIASHLLAKKQSGEAILRNLYRDRGELLMRHIRLEESSRVTNFDEDEFVRSYPFLPRTIDLWLDIMAGIREHPAARGNLRGDLAIVDQIAALLVSQPGGIVEQPVGTLVSIDRIYGLLEGHISAKKVRDVRGIGERFEWDEDYPRMAGRVARALCLMEFVKSDLPRTTRNIAALLIQRVTEPPPRDAVAAILYHLRQAGLAREAADGWQLCDYDELRRIAAELAGLSDAVGVVNPRPPGWRNRPIQLGKKMLARALAWYIRPVREFDASVTRSLEELVSSLDRLSMRMADESSRNAETLEQLSMNVAALEGRIALLDKRHFGGFSGAKHRTTYVLGLFGTGRRYVNDLLLKHLGGRVKYFRDTIRLHPGPTPMIYSGHATLKYASRMQEPPAVMCRILEAVRARFADSIFIYRHPLDSLLTNWVWWRAHLHDNRAIAGISDVYPDTDALCADLDRNFAEFQLLADGDPEFFALSPGSRFLSFAEFVEETELHLQAATLALRLEDFMSDPLREFTKIASLISLEIDPGASVAPPKSKCFGYLAVQDKVPRFRKYVGGLDSETRARIERIGYPVEM
jgi:hypothetical protein